MPRSAAMALFDFPGLDLIVSAARMLFATQETPQLQLALASAHSRSRDNLRDEVRGASGGRDGEVVTHGSVIRHRLRSAQS
jgi:hypothetical protein